MANSDNFVDLTADDKDINPKVTIKVLGQPQALPRSRFNRKGFYNPKKSEMEASRQEVKKQVPALKHGVLFKEGIMVAVTIRCSLKRPNTDFKGKIRRKENLKSNVAKAVPIAPDIDNLAKFVLDALNGIIYKDDCQVVSLNVQKIRDNELECNGSTEVTVELYH
jgi:Holliday junction resolvase RusA-like endonuclease